MFNNLTVAIDKKSAKVWSCGHQYSIIVRHVVIPEHLILHNIITEMMMIKLKKKKQGKKWVLLSGTYI